MRLSGEPYLSHPLEVAHIARRYEAGFDLAVRGAAA